MNYAERKKLHVELAEKHLSADMLIKGSYGETGGDFKGCSIGCLSHDIDPTRTDYHANVAEYFRYPEWLARLQDTVFEWLPSPQNVQWHKQLADALARLPENYDWKKAYHRVQIALLRIAHQHAGSSKDVVQRVIDLNELSADGATVSTDDWEAAEEAARAAAWAAEEAARAAARVAWAAARAAARAARAAWTAGAAVEAARAAWTAGAAAQAEEEAAQAEEEAAQAAARTARAAELAARTARAAELAAGEAAWTSALSAVEAARSAAGAAALAARAAARAAWTAEEAAGEAARAAAFEEIRDGVLAALAPDFD